MGDPIDQPGPSGPGRATRGGGGRRGRRRGDTRDPRRARERALKILFQADVRGEDPAALLARIVDDPRAWAMLDDADPDEAADLTGGADAADATADPEPHATARQRDALALDGFTRSLVGGVADHRAELDELIQRYARRWTVSRMPAIDRNLLRLGTYELRHEVTSPAVVINEVIELAKRLSTEDSGRYVNGVLEAVRRHLADEAADASVATPTGPAGADEVELEPVVPATADAPAFDAEPELEAEPEPEPLGPASEVVATDDVLPPPDEDGDAVDLREPPEDVVDDGEDAAEADADDPPAVDEDADAAAPEDIPGQQQLF